MRQLLRTHPLAKLEAYATYAIRWTPQLSRQRRAALNL